MFYGMNRKMKCPVWLKRTYSTYTREKAEGYNSFFILIIPIGCAGGWILRILTGANRITTKPFLRFDFNCYLYETGFFTSPTA